MSSIYHYCSVDTFYKIICNKCIRLSDLNKTNDYMEKRWVSKVLVKALEDEFSTYGITINLKEDYWYSENILNHLQFLESDMESLVYTTSPTLITCFSDNSDKLSQWRAYGDDGYGVSIGFKSKILKDIKNTKMNVYLKKVIYKEANQILELRGLIRSTILYIRNMFKSDIVKISEDFNEYFIDEFDAFCEVLVDKIECMSCYIKNPAFVEEDESRIIYLPRLYTEMKDSEIRESFNERIQLGKFYLDSIKYYPRSNQLVAFCDLHFDQLIPDNIITEIVLGPKSRLKEDDVFYFLMSQGFNARDIIVNKSSATYR